MKLSDHQFEFLKDVAKLIEFAVKQGMKVTGGELYRPQLMQDHYFDTGKSKTKNSYHSKRLAIDLNFFYEGRLTYEFEKILKIGNYWESLNPLNRWGGDWNGNDLNDDNFVDTPHFERRV